MIATWPCPQKAIGRPGGASSDEYAAAFDAGRRWRLLIVPALFDEANRLRRFTLAAMRALNAAGIDSFLPDLPGTNESLAALADQTIGSWREAMAAAAHHFAATHVLAMRGGALVAPALPGWALAPVSGGSILRQMIRSRMLTAREAGREERSEDLLAMARAEGIVLAGHALSAAMVEALHDAVPDDRPALPSIGPPLWLRAEPGEDPAQSAALANWIASELVG